RHGPGSNRPGRVSILGPVGGAFRRVDQHCAARKPPRTGGGDGWVSAAGQGPGRDRQSDTNSTGPRGRERAGGVRSTALVPGTDAEERDVGSPERTSLPSGPRAARVLVPGVRTRSKRVPYLHRRLPCPRRTGI